MKLTVRASLLALALVTVAIPLPALAFDGMPAALKGGDEIRPSKFLSVESAGTLPMGARLLSVSGRDLNLAYGLSDRLQLDLGTGGFNLLPAMNTQLAAQAKARLLGLGPLSVGAGFGVVAVTSPTQSTLSAANFFMPISLALGPRLDLNLVPKMSTLDSAVGADLGLALHVTRRWVLIAEDRVNATNGMVGDFLVGGAYTGFGPRTTLACGVVSGNGTTPYSVGIGATLHQGF